MSHNNTQAQSGDSFLVIAGLAPRPRRVDPDIIPDPAPDPWAVDPGLRVSPASYFDATEPQARSKSLAALGSNASLTVDYELEGTRIVHHPVACHIRQVSDYDPYDPDASVENMMLDDASSDCGSNEVMSVAQSTGMQTDDESDDDDDDSEEDESDSDCESEYEETSPKKTRRIAQNLKTPRQDLTTQREPASGPTRSKPRPAARAARVIAQAAPYTQADDASASADAGEHTYITTTTGQQIEIDWCESAKDIPHRAVADLRARGVPISPDAPHVPLQHRILLLLGFACCGDESQAFLACTVPGCGQLDAPQRPGDARRHLAIHYRAELEWACKGCPKTFSRRDALERHLGGDKVNTVCKGASKQRQDALKEFNEREDVVRIRDRLSEASESKTRTALSKNLCERFVDYLKEQNIK
ncbi:C2H2-type domain-containing protein [Mycena chlorophos]|uniref:C2H2-type domain-containing protein n=1 Tax=Mycena chlorophos TaxID=658473 RepID=A0A8H6SSM9_MYCCL|nr:C2H2-type domain-containing protein [Mycena chlorophos]